MARPPPSDPKAAPDAQEPEVRRHPDGSAEDDQDFLNQVDDLTDRYVTRSNAEIHGLFEILGSKRRLLTVNFLAGLSRGVGFFLGVTLVGGILIGALALTIDFAAAAVGFEDITFQSIVRVFAKKAVEAEQVWESMREESQQTQEPQATPVDPPPEEPDGR